MEGFAAGATLSTFALLIVLAVRSARRRRRALARVAASLDLWLVSDDKGRTIAGRFDHLHALRRCNSQTADHLMGHIDGRPILICTQSSRAGESFTVYDTLVVIEIPLDAPRVRIERRRWSDFMTQWIAGPEVPLGSTPFSRRFRVMADDPRFAHDLLRPHLVAFVMQHRRWKWELHRNVVAMHQSRLLKPHEIPDAIRIAAGFVNLMPHLTRGSEAGGAAPPSARNSVAARSRSVGIPMARPIGGMPAR